MFHFQEKQLSTLTITQTTRVLRSVFSFPNPVNEVAARSVAGMVVALTLAIIFTGQPWLMILLAYGFLARVAAGPTLSPMGLLATRVLAPRIAEDRPVPGPPKRFAQTVGLIFSVTALALYYVAGSMAAAQGVLAILVIFASLEAFVGFCVGCFVFNRLMAWGLIPQSVCEECRAFSARKEG